LNFLLKKLYYKEIIQTTLILSPTKSILNMQQPSFPFYHLDFNFDLGLDLKKDKFIKREKPMKVLGETSPFQRKLEMTLLWIFLFFYWHGLGQTLNQLLIRLTRGLDDGWIRASSVITFFFFYQFKETKI